MSLINQVLSDLEKRGANALPGAASIRAVPVQKNHLRMALLAAAMLVLAFVLSNFWSNGSRQKTASPASVMQAPAPKPVAVPQAQSQLQPVAVVMRETHQEKDGREENGQKTAAKISDPATRLSLELRAIPSPSHLRVKTVGAATGPHSSSSKAASPPVPAAAADAPTAPGDTHTEKSKAMVATPFAPDGAADGYAAIAAGGVDKQTSVRQQADNEYRKANGLMQQGRIDEALPGYEAALQLDAGHDEARQALVGLLLKHKRNADAERVLQDGLNRNPVHTGFAMMLARLQVERDALPLALDTLHKTLPYASRQADYQAFVAALLQRLERHKEAVEHYRITLQLAPNSGVWLMGLGISLQAAQRKEEARDAFRRAVESGNLSAELQAFVKQRLKEL